MTDRPPSSTAQVESGPADTGLYKAREKIHPREVNGTFAKLRNLTVVVLLGLYYVLPWVQMDGRQALLLDLPARKFYLFGLTLWPQDLIYLSALLIIAALSLFFFTALAGRLWCGYACPQTVWTEVFIIMERWVEGSRQQQLKLDKEPMSVRKFRIRATKQLLWIRVRAVDRLHLRRLLQSDPGTRPQPRDLEPRALGDLLDLLLQLRHLGQCRHAARAGLHLHVPLRALPERHVRPRHPADRLRHVTRRAARAAQARRRPP